MTGSVESPDTLWNKSFLVIMAVTFLTYANISVFFKFYDYLSTCPIDPEWFGTLIGIFAAVSLVLRPLVSPFFTPSNARSFLALGTFLVILSLSGYSLTTSLPGLMAVRIFHSLAFVIMGSALTGLMMSHVPAGGSARFFGLLSIIILIPNTLIPPLLPAFINLAGGFPGVLLGFAVLSAIIFLLLPLIPKPEPAGAADLAKTLPLNREEVLENLKDIHIIGLLGAMLCLYCGHAMTFFFLDRFSQGMGISQAGLFLTLATGGEIGVRLVGGRAMDKGNKHRLLAATLLCLSGGFLLMSWLPHIHETARLPLFFLTGTGIGIGWGVAMPVFNGLLFDISRPRFRILNTNLGMQMFQAGFFIGPFVGGAIGHLAGFGSVFLFCALLSLAGYGLIKWISRRYPTNTG